MMLGFGWGCNVFMVVVHGVVFSSRYSPMLRRHGCYGAVFGLL